jgi:hypothetical protein
MSESGAIAKLGKILGEDSRFVPAIGYLLLSLLVLLFVDKLPDPMKSWLLPPLIFCTICAVFIGWLQTMFFVRNGDKRISLCQFHLIVGLHAPLIVALPIYWFYRGVI